MVFLTMTSAVVEALERIQSSDISKQGNLPPAPTQPVQAETSSTNCGHKGRTTQQEKKMGGGSAGEKPPEGPHTANSTSPETARSEKDKIVGNSTEPSLLKPRIGNPITHGQIIDLSRDMKRRGLEPYQLEVLLKGSRVYFPPPPPKPEPTSEYKALMAHLRREEEARSYERMTNPPPPMETFSQRFPASSAANAFSSNQRSMKTKDTEDDGITYADVDRQMTLILNVLISIVACAAAIWIAARWWSTPARLALSMSGSLLVGIAEVAVYSGYVWRLNEAKGEAQRLQEVKEVVNTWVVGAGEDTPNPSGDETSIPIKPKEDREPVRMRLQTKNKAQ